MNAKWLTVKEFARALYDIFLKQRPTQLAAALAFYGLFSFAPVLFIAKSVAQVFINVEINSTMLYERLEKVLGPQAVPIIQKAVDNVSSRTTSGSWLATTISIIVIIFAALGFFLELQYSLNRIWDLPPLIYPNPVAFIKGQFLYFLMVIGLGFLLVLTALINFVLTWLDLYIQLDKYIQVINGLILLGLFTLAFAIIYKVLPNETIRWKDVWIGALLAGILEILGGILFGVYIRVSHVGSSFAAAGAFIVILIGIYYFAQIFLFGAMFTRVYATRFGSKQSRPIMKVTGATVHSSDAPE